MTEDDGNEVLDYLHLPRTVRFGTPEGFEALLLQTLVCGFTARFYRSKNMPQAEFCCVVDPAPDSRVKQNAHSQAHRTPGGALADAILRWKRNYTQVQ